MNIVRVMREVGRELRDLAKDDWPLVSGERLKDLAGRLAEVLEEPERAVDLAMCIGAECIKLHGLRVATWRGFGPCSRYDAICDECYRDRLDDEERQHMVELFGAAWVRHLGLHELHQGRLPGRSTGEGQR